MSINMLPLSSESLNSARDIVIIGMIMTTEQEIAEAVSK